MFWHVSLQACNFFPVAQRLELKSSFDLSIFVLHIYLSIVTLDGSQDVSLALI